MNIMEPLDMGIMSDLPEIYPENLKTNKLFPASYPTAQSNFIFSWILKNYKMSIFANFTHINSILLGIFSRKLVCNLTEIDILWEYSPICVTCENWEESEKVVHYENLTVYHQKWHRLEITNFDM